MRPPDSATKSWRRPDPIKLFGATSIAGPAIFQRTMARAATSKVIKIGHVSSPTGVFAPFAQADPFMLNQMRTALGKGISNGGVGYQVQIISKDSQSSTTRASEVASDLILRDKADLLVSSGTPETTNAVADQAEANEVPCVTGFTASQPYFFVLHSTPHKRLTSTYHF